jgi:CheY-like chemotaxis protein
MGIELATRAGTAAARVLVVEDEFLISEMISEALAMRGFDVQAFATAEDALRYLASGPPVDVLFTDINLAGKMDGSALAMRVRELRPALPVVYASARANGLDQLPVVPNSLFVPKPYSPFAVCSLLSSLVAAVH